MGVIVINLDSILQYTQAIDYKQSQSKRFSDEAHKFVFSVPIIHECKANELTQFLVSIIVSLIYETSRTANVSRFNNPEYLKFQTADYNATIRSSLQKYGDFKLVKNI